MFYPSTYAAIHRSSFTMHYYCNTMFLVKQKAYLELSVIILEIPCFIVGHAIHKKKSMLIPIHIQVLKQVAILHFHMS